MGKFIFKRIVKGFLVLFGVVTIVFFLFNVLPGDPIRLRMGQHTDQKSIDAIRADLGLDQPLRVQYFRFLNDLSFISVHDTLNNASNYYLDTAKYGHPYHLLNFGKGKCLVIKVPYLRRSYMNQEHVSEIIGNTLPATIVLAVTSILFASVFGIFFGIVCALRKNSWLDKTISVFAMFGMAVPSFFSAMIIAWLFGYLWRDYTGLKNIGSLYSIDVYTAKRYLDLKNLILPAFTLGMRPLALIVQLTRSSMLEVLSFDYVRTAQAKGLNRYKVVAKHSLKNALNPVITAISGWFAGLMAGAVFVEDIFDWKGIGNKVVVALLNNDLPVVMGCTLVFSTFFVMINIIVDIVYAFLDPRVRLQ